MCFTGTSIMVTAVKVIMCFTGTSMLVTALKIIMCFTGTNMLVTALKVIMCFTGTSILVAAWNLLCSDAGADPEGGGQGCLAPPPPFSGEKNKGAKNHTHRKKNQNRTTMKQYTG